jgi:hypothetical protein
MSVILAQRPSAKRPQAATADPDASQRSE